MPKLLINKSVAFISDTLGESKWQKPAPNHGGDFQVDNLMEELNDLQGQKTPFSGVAGLERVAAKNLANIKPCREIRGERKRKENHAKRNRTNQQELTGGGHSPVNEI